MPSGDDYYYFYYLGSLFGAREGAQWRNDKVGAPSARLASARRDCRRGADWRGESRRRGCTLGPFVLPIGRRLLAQRALVRSSPLGRAWSSESGPKVPSRLARTRAQPRTFFGLFRPVGQHKKQRRPVFARLRGGFLPPLRVLGSNLAGAISCIHFFSPTA